MNLDDIKSKITGELGGLLGGGGAGAILGKLKGLGLGNIASSWVGKGANLPIPADMMEKLLGNSTIAAIAAKLGVSHDQASKSLADVLPHAIDHMTPDGEEPKDDAAPPDPVELTKKLFGGGANDDAAEQG